MADPLRRTLLAKLRGKKSKKGASVGGGYGSTAAAAAAAAAAAEAAVDAAVAAAHGGREGKEKVVQTRRDSGEARPVVLLTRLDCTAERMSTYENCVVGEAVQGCVRADGLRDCRAPELVLARPQERSGGGRVRVNEELLGVSLQRAAQFAGRVAREGGGRPPHAQQKHFVSVPRQCSVGDSIGFGDNSDPALYRVRVEARSGVCSPAEGRVPAADRGQPRHMAGTGATAADRSLEADPQVCATHVRRNSASKNTEETVLIRNVESYGPDGAGDGRGASLQSPTFFPTELEICDLLTAPDGSLRFSVGSEDEDYYDNEILPFYEASRVKSDEERAMEAVELPPGLDSAQETDRLRSQLKEAYYLLITAMNDISLEVQQASEQHAASSCSSHSRDSLCSRTSARNLDSDSWSSGGDHSPQQVSDTDSLLLCLTGNLDPASRGSRLKSKSVVNLCPSERRPTLLRSASDGAFRYPAGPPVCGRPSGAQAGEEEAPQPKEGEASGAGDSSDPRVLRGAVSSDELLHDGGGDGDDLEQLHESSGSVNSLTGSSDGNAEAAACPGLKQEPTGAQVQRANSINKGHGVTVNKMQEWMHKGRLLSSEMKQRIEGSPSPQSQERSGPAGVPTCSRGVKPAKAKSPTGKTPAWPQQQQQQQQQPASSDGVQTSPAGDWEAVRSSETPSWRPPLTTTITVSKKRNWLQQSSFSKSHGAKEEPQGMLGAEEEAAQLPPPPSPSPDHLRPPGSRAPSRPARLHLPQVSIGQAKASPHPRSVDPAEENDADDEGEIWYNPIPEDEEPDLPHGAGSVRLLVPPRAEPQRRPSSRGPDPGPEPLGESVGGDGSQGNAAHSTEAAHPHRQTLACKPQEEAGLSSGRATDGPDLPNAISSPPSSPNPAKKSSSINWSFPDKIKSPRTVRKISMKMKKLPELSRKLSVKGNPSSSSGSSGSQSEPRAHSPRNAGSGPEAGPHSSGPPRLTASGGGQASRNVISRYHLDSSVSTQHSFSKKKSSGSSKSASKGGYLSDGDSPELVAKAGKHGPAEAKGGKGKETEGGSSKLNGTELDIDAFRHYSFTEQPKCSQFISGLMSLHFYGAEDLKPPRVDSRDVYCAIQVDSVNKARTALLTCRTTFLDMDHTFNIELENAQHLKLVVFSWEPTPRRNRVCCHGTVVLPALFRVTRCHQLAVKLEPRGLIYVKLSLMEQWQNSLDGGPGGDREPQVFGVEAWRVVERENTGLMVPLIIGKCINEIEKRGCQVVGLYRLCGSAAVKKELREAFERDSHGVELCENTYPDVNVITGVLKDYLRELPYPLITKHLYEAVLESMASRPLRIGASGCENDQADSEHTVGLLESLPEVERMTLRRLLDHLKLVASHQEVNKMTCQNLAVCFGPVLLSQRQEASCHTNRVFIDSEELASALHFKKHIEVLHYLLQLWPVVDPNGRSSQTSSSAPASSDLPSSAPPLRRRKERPQVLNLSEAEMAGVLRPRPGRLDSPSNRYAGDWSGCGDSYFPPETLLPPSKEEADYDDVPSEEAAAEEEVRDKPEDGGGDEGQKVSTLDSDPAELERPPREEEDEDGGEEEKMADSDGSGNGPPLEDEEEEENEEEEEERVYQHILPPRLPKEHTYQAYMKIQDISPVLSNRVNLRDLQESIDTLIGNLERELNKNKLNVGY